VKPVSLALASLAAAAFPALGLANDTDSPVAVNGAPQPTQAPDGRVLFPPSFFAEFAPQSALDMVRRVPGFSLDGGDNRRGFSGAGANVLIDGERPSSKSQDVFDVLSRIPAGQVERIELLRGAQSTEAAGQTQVVNVVRRSGADQANGGGLYEVSFEGSESGRITARGQASYSGRLGDGDYSVGVSRYMQERPLSGLRWASLADDTLLFTRKDETPRTFREARINGSFSTPLWGGKLNLNAEAGRENFRTSLDSFGFNAAGAATDSFQLNLNYRTRDREIGADWERDFNGVTLKLIGLDRRRWTADDEATTEREANGAFDNSVAQRVRNTARESIVRGTLGFQPIAGLTFETGLEAAYNSLDAGLELSEDLGAGPRPIPLPSANVLIEEDRAEAFARSVYRPAAGWTWEAALAWETSTISQSGDTAASRTLSFWKPSIQVTQDFGDKNQWRMRLYRDVGQLDFGDFASSADLNDQRVAAGNPNLEPFTEWRLETAVDLRFGDTGALSLTAFASQISDVNDSVPIVTSTDIFDAPGNIGDGEIYGLEVTATIPVDAILPGGKIEIEGQIARSEVIDPITRRARSFSGFSDAYFDAELRQDIPAWSMAWGLEYEGESEFERFRLSERETYVEGPFLSAFVETTALPVKVRLLAHNLTDTSFRRERHFFAPTRADDPSFSELRKRHFGRFLVLELSGKF